MPITDYGSRKLLAHSVGKAAYPMPAATYICLYTSSPTDEGGGTVITDAIYQQIRWDDPAYNDDDEVIIANSNTIIWSAASSNWGQVSHWGILDAAAGSPNLIWYGEFEVPYEDIGIGDQFSIAAGDVVLSMD